MSLPSLGPPSASAAPGSAPPTTSGHGIPSRERRSRGAGGPRSRKLQQQKLMDQLWGGVWEELSGLQELQYAKQTEERAPRRRPPHSSASAGTAKSFGSHLEMGAPVTAPVSRLVSTYSGGLWPPRDAAEGGGGLEAVEPSSEDDKPTRHSRPALDAWPTLPAPPTPPCISRPNLGSPVQVPGTGERHLEFR